MANQNFNSDFIVSPDAVVSFNDDGIVVLHRGNGSLYKSNGTGARIWRLVEQRLRLEAIAEEISSHYQIVRDTAREHTARFLDELERNALIRREVAS